MTFRGRDRSRRRRRLLHTVLLAAASLAAGAPFSDDAAAQCFPDEPVPGWEAGDLSLIDPGVSRPAPGGADGDYQLCSAGGGFAPASDAFRYLIQRRNGSIELVARLESIDAIGEAGLVLRTDVRDPAPAGVRIGVDVSGRARLFSELRTEEDGPADAGGTSEVSIAPPVWLRVRREGTVVSTAYSTTGALWIKHLTYDAAGGELATEQLKTGMYQASKDPTVPATATFTGAAFAPSALPPEPACLGGFTLPSAGPGQVDLIGEGLDRVTAVTIGGQPAPILSTSSQLLTVETPPVPLGADPLANSRVVLEGAFDPVRVEAPLAWSGVAFVRGDVDGDQVVDAVDVQVLQRALGRGEALAHCEAAADIDGDLRVTWQDHALLERWVFEGILPPPPPFPLPGFPAPGTPSLLCDAAPRPHLASITDGSGIPIRAGTAVQVGDELRLFGRDLPLDPLRTVVYFGDARTTVLPDSTPTELHVRVERVPTDGAKCPIVFEDLAVEAPVVAFDEGAPYTEQRFGRARGLVGETGATGLCPEFAASGPPPFAYSSWDPARGSLRIDFDLAQLQPTAPYQMDLRLFAPNSASGARGSRVARFVFQPQDVLTEEQWLAAVARRIRAELGSDDECDCEFEVVSLWPEPAVSVDPCEPAMGSFTWPDPGPGPDPPFEPEYPLKAPPGPLSAADAFQAQQPSCGGEWEPDTHPRLWAWCEFERITRPHSNGSGLPIWEFYIPDDVVMGGPNDIDDLGPPQSRSPGQKHIEFNVNGYQWARNEGYWLGCAVAARLAYCTGGHADWMPAFPPGAKAIKTFWKPLGKLPFSANPDDFYSYDPPGSTTRRYLVGMHVNTGAQSITDPWQWTTFWVPRGSDTFDKNGDPLDYDTSCSVGGPFDKPAELTGVWANFSMCNQDEAAGGLCGNPWAHGECTQSCSSCHQTVGSVDYEGGNNQLPLSFSWLPSLIPSGVQSCLDYINQNAGAYDQYTPEVCQ